MSEYIRNRRGNGEEEDGFFCRFTFGQFFALLVLEVCTLFFVFYLGARYGREFLGLGASVNVAAESAAKPGESAVMTTTDPEAAELAKELVSKAQTPELKERITQMFEGAQGKPSAAGEEKKLPEVVSANRTGDAQAAGLASDAASAENANTEAKLDSTVAEQDKQQVARNQDEVPVKRESPEPSSATPSTGEQSGVVRVKSTENGKYSIQVGSYPQAGEANRMLERWKVKGYPAYVMIADIPERGRWYRVRIGGFGTRDDATRYLTELKTTENVEALIVMNEQ